MDEMPPTEEIKAWLLGDRPPFCPTDDIRFQDIVHPHVQRLLNFEHRMRATWVSPDLKDQLHFLSGTQVPATFAHHGPHNVKPVPLAFNLLKRTGLEAISSLSFSAGQVQFLPDEFAAPEHQYTAKIRGCQACHPDYTEGRRSRAPNREGRRIGRAGRPRRSTGLGAGARPPGKPRGVSQTHSESTQRRVKNPAVVRRAGVSRRTSSAFQQLLHASISSTITYSGTDQITATCKTPAGKLRRQQTVAQLPRDPANRKQECRWAAAQFLTSSDRSFYSVPQP